MKHTIPILAISSGIVFFATGCSKPDNPPSPKVVEQAPSVAGSLAAPPLPDPIVPKGAEAASPKPGQAGDHSSEAFKGGGKTDPHK